jgi:hypothetical protein
MRKTTLTAVIAAVLGCETPEPETAPGDAIETIQQKELITFPPWGNAVPVRAMFGRTAGWSHKVLYQRLDNGACQWVEGLGEVSMNQDVVMLLSDGNDVATIAPETGSTFICNGTPQTLFAPNFIRAMPSGFRRFSALILGAAGNDTLNCAGWGECHGNDGNDTLIARQANTGPPYLKLFGGAGRDKLVVDGDHPVALYGGDDQDCLAATHTSASSSLLVYNCANPSSTSDPAWDHSVGWIGSWCNQVSTNFCASW